ncbi:carbohydrate kinase family protein [Lysinimonas soli]|uniref:Carbohydrate kinase family protein n=1 Tax=Lysinimonas soli TaxID=1074233 RepID=A0ABW0NQ40_9MICO
MSAAGTDADLLIRNRIVAFGDIVNDIVAVPRGPIRSDTDTPSTIRPRPGGSAANTAAWLGSLRAPVDFVGCVGLADADYHESLFREQGVTPHLAIAPGLPTSMIVIIVEGDRRTMLTERGANAALSVDDLSDEVLARAAVLHLTGYSLLDGPRSVGLQQLIARAHAAGATVSLNPGSAGYIADFGPDAFAAGIEGTDILFANVHEARLLCSETAPVRVAKALGERYGIAVITQGGDSVIVAERGQRAATVSVPNVRVVDPTGAGDAMAAGFLQHWLVSRDAIAAAEAGVAVAARAVMVMGGRPVI